MEKDIDADLKPRSRALTGWSCRLEAEVVHNRITVKNVVGVLEGSGPLAKEMVVIGAHYDHIGFGSNMRRGIGGVAGPGAPGGVGFPFSEMGASAIHHGADDNASGTTAVMELARRFGARKDRSGRRLVFMTFTAEESGLIGSRYYCEHPIFPLADMAAMINMDMIGRLQDDKLLVGGVGTAREFPTLLNRLARKYRLDLLREMSGQGPSDHSSFYAHNIPVLFLFTGFHEQYHRPTDRVETINVAGLRRVAAFAADALGELRTAPKRPAFTKNSAGFARDKTLWAKAPSVGVMPDYSHKGEGVLVAGVVRSTPAARAGLKKGDRIMAVSGKAVKDAVAFLALARTLPMGQKVELTVMRDGKPQPVALQLARPRRPADRRFGFTMDFTDTKGGLLLTEVPENSPAARAGLKKGDRIVAIGSQPVSGVADYVTALRDVGAGEKVKLTVSRGGKEQTFEVQAAAATGRRP
jgi:peptidase M28-like protein/PDZ domain-containing protein